MEIKQLDAEYTYDYDLDIINIKVNQEYTYQESVDLDVGVFLDIDMNNFPVNFEILSASKRINIEKEFLINPNGNVTIFIAEDLIRLDVYFEINGKEEVLSYINRHEENLKLNNLEVKFALAWIFLPNLIFIKNACYFFVSNIK